MMVKKKALGATRSCGNAYADGTERQEIWVTSGSVPRSTGVRIPVVLEIADERWHAGIRCTLRHPKPWICPDVRTEQGKKEALARVLGRAGIGKNTRVLLHVEGRRIRVQPLG